MPQKEPSSSWWGPSKVQPGQTGYWRIGPLRLWIQRLEGEWRIVHEQGSDSLDASLEREMPVEAGDLLSREDVCRYVFPDSSGNLVLGVALADRPVVSTSDKPLNVPPGEEVTLYVSSLLWVCIDAGKPAKRLTEIPVFRPSDTWFGSDTQEGELCYAIKTFHRVKLDDIPVRPHRATTAVLVRNRAETMLKLERMRLPAPNLSLFQTEDGRLWTQDVIMERTGEDDFASMRLRNRTTGTKAPAGKAKLVSGPRQKAEDNLVVRAFTSLFGWGQSG
jgi:hypothetical protein